MVLENFARFRFAGTEGFERCDRAAGKILEVSMEQWLWVWSGFEVWSSVPSLGAVLENYLGLLQVFMICAWYDIHGVDWENFACSCDHVHCAT